jgi:hypothetical protein
LNAGQRVESKGEATAKAIQVLLTTPNPSLEQAISKEFIGLMGADQAELARAIKRAAILGNRSITWASWRKLIDSSSMDSTK